MHVLSLSQGSTHRRAPYTLLCVRQLPCVYSWPNVIQRFVNQTLRPVLLCLHRRALRRFKQARLKACAPNKLIGLADPDMALPAASVFAAAALQSCRTLGSAGTGHSLAAAALNAARLIHTSASSFTPQLGECRLSVRADQLKVLLSCCDLRLWWRSTLCTAA
jgi:hypothetical protein